MNFQVFRMPLLFGLPHFDKCCFSESYLCFHLQGSVKHQIVFVKAVIVIVKRFLWIRSTRWWAKLLCRPVFSHFRTFWVTCHTHSHIIKLTVLLLSSQSHFIIWPRSFYCSQLLIFILLFFCFFVFCYTVARITANVTAEAIVTFAELCKILCFSFFM